MTGVGIVGVGFMGMIHYLAAQRIGSGRVVAICTRDPKKLAGDWTDIQGNFGPRGEQMNLEGINRHATFQAILADPTVGLIDLCVPNDAHAKMAIEALEAGKDVLVEKPIALEIEDADRMIAAARRTGRMLMIAHVLPFFPEFAHARSVVESGDFGPLLAARFTRVISKPDWSTGIADTNRSGGPAIDLHIHDTHFIGLVCGSPIAVRSTGVVQNGAVSHLSTQYLYDQPNLSVSADSGALNQPGRPFMHGFELWMERGTLSFEFATIDGAAHVATPLTLMPEKGAAIHPPLGSGDPIDAFAAELEAATIGVRDRVVPPPLSAPRARLALALCRAEIASVLSGETVRVAPSPAATIF